MAARQIQTLVAATLALGCSPAVLALEAVEGIFALPGTEAAVTGEMKVRNTGSLTRELQFSYADIGTSEPITGFDVELTQELHVLAVDAGLSTLIHRHVEHADQDGRFTVALPFPEAGLYHVFTDAVPTGLGQQVLRFDLDVDVDGSDSSTAGGMTREPVSIIDGPIDAHAGNYTVALDASELRPGTESMLSLSVEKDGAPADDITPYLGVAAHAVLIRAEDLAYVHAHAMEDGEAGGHGSHGGGHGHDAGPATDGGAGHHGAPASGHDHDGAEMEHGGDHHGAPAEGHGADAAGHGTDTHAGHGDHGAASAEAVDPDMTVHVTLPAAGDYALWIEFTGGGEVVTVPFALTVPAK